MTARQKEIVRAQLALAVRTGKLSRPSHCQWCATDGSKWIRGIQAHHEDYTKPLVVLWLCPGCHGQRHVDIVQGYSLSYSRRRLSRCQKGPGAHTLSAMANRAPRKALAERVSFSCDSDVLHKAKSKARGVNRSLSNYVSVLIRDDINPEPREAQ